MYETIENLAVLAGYPERIDGEVELLMASSKIRGDVSCLF
jgi:hypothetical protein